VPNLSLADWCMRCLNIRILPRDASSGEEQQVERDRLPETGVTAQPADTQPMRIARSEAPISAEGSSRAVSVQEPSIAANLDPQPGRSSDEAEAEPPQPGEDEIVEAVRRTESWIEIGNVSATLDLRGLAVQGWLHNLPPQLEAVILDRCGLQGRLDHLPLGLRQLDVPKNVLTDLEVPQALERLTISDNQLSRLPELPETLVYLDARANPLTDIPDHWPPSLAELRLAADEAQGFGQLRSLGALPRELKLLDASRQPLERLPDDLPHGLTELFVQGCGLTSLPQLPPHLLMIDLTNNRLTDIPLHLLELSPDCEIFLHGNPLSQQAADDLWDVTNDPAYSGPQIHFDWDADSEASVGSWSFDEDEPQGPRSFQQAVTDWLGDDSETTQMWDDLADETGAADFARFLDRLRQTVNSGDPAFLDSVVNWLREVATNPRLRVHSFLVASDAATTCEDRVLLTWNAMQTARLTTHVENGVYDKRLPELIPLARGMFRLTALEKIAREKAREMQAARPLDDDEVDEIEVYLAFQVQLREQLELPLATRTMAFFRVSGVTDDELQAAARRVLIEEDAQFVDFLSTGWQPWEAVVQRLDEAAYVDAQEQLIEALDGEFRERLERRLAEANLSGDADAERAAGAQVSAELANEIKGRLTRKVLANSGLESLLDPPPARGAD
jgi:C-terminal novel E3 ligase, LRR-interacting